MKLGRAFRDRHWGAAVAIDLIAGPFFAMLYLARGRLAVAYGIAEAAFFVVVFALVVRFNLVGPAPGGDLGGWAYLAVAPIRIVGAFLPPGWPAPAPALRRRCGPGTHAGAR